MKNIRYYKTEIKCFHFWSCMIMIVNMNEFVSIYDIKTLHLKNWRSFLFLENKDIKNLQLVYRKKFSNIFSWYSPFTKKTITSLLNFAIFVIECFFRILVIKYSLYNFDSNVFHLLFKFWLLFFILIEQFNYD